MPRVPGLRPIVAAGLVAILQEKRLFEITDDNSDDFT
jgi:hypothetical protein